MTTIKTNVASFRSELNLRVPTPHKTTDLKNYRLLFFVYIPIDNDKIHSYITEHMVEAEPERYIFLPVMFAK